jgi:DNA-binding NtrC family response regulator
MSPAFKSIVIPISEVPFEEVSAADDALKQTVLVVDDEHLVADTLAIIFRRAGFSTFKAYDAKGALEIANAVTPDILVSDIDMPGMNGVDLAMALLGMLPDCRVLLFSGHATFADLSDARAAGHDFPLLPKPVHPSIMLENVSKCLGREWHGTKSRLAEVFPMPRLRQTA